MQANEFDEYETLQPDMTEDDVMEWFQKRLNRMPEALDVYKVGFLGGLHVFFDYFLYVLNNYLGGQGFLSIGSVF